MDQEQINIWIDRVKDAKKKGINHGNFRKKYKLSGGLWTTIKALINDPDLTAWPKGNTGAAKPRAKRAETSKNINYHALAIPEIVEDRKQNSQPVFCLVVAFESKEAAFAAMGRI